MPTVFTLDINGIEVLSCNLRVRQHPRGHVDLEYPAPIPETPPVFSPTDLHDREFLVG
jgi:hypothetical protein